MIKTIIFDLDDTLYNERNFVFGSFKEVCKYLCKTFNKDYEDMYKDAIEIFNDYGRGKIFNILCDKYNIKVDINKLVNIYRNAKPNLNLYEDALWLFERCGNRALSLEYKSLKFNILSKDYCNNKKYNLGIITDGKASVQWNKIEILKLKNYVEKIIVTDDYGIDYWKPNKFAYLEMIKYFQCNPDECVYVGDNPNKDFIGAKKLGIYTVRIIREIGDYMNAFLDKQYEADFNIKSLKELNNLIDKL